MRLILGIRFILFYILAAVHLFNHSYQKLKIIPDTTHWNLIQFIRITQCAGYVEMK